MSDSPWQPLEEVIPVDLFRAEVRFWAERIGIQPKQVVLRPMRRKWGSCSSKGCLTFNLELLSQPASFRREVIIEELLHLKIPNHGKLFRALKMAYLRGHTTPS
ncbi:M48 family metallopeptidase [Meiothermus rufus]|uniref:M48 metallopeptidase family protein n=1 Tax=Meiothermus rufus TaxID=604332 RepID=UPI000567D379|nr:M48 family metallopeptidase [Meiothermus rufus]